ncbi:MAG: deoxyribose-phosphate aldolase [Gammaproteobacteria bacterium]|nr:deoxyribose-phosphate aldolase [Gammaproteobacteria bacterium]MCW5583503.1 deoxyribose-phosphate aldolase [Gammaproteobacteria bacterium]
MYWTDVIKEHIQTLKPVDITPQLIQRILGLVDLTSLNSTDTEQSVTTLCEKAQTPWGPVAAVCVYPQFVHLAVVELNHTPVKVATVTNFPEGENTLDSVLMEIGRALQDGVQEIDVVFPYQRYLAGEREYAQTFISTCKAACGERVLLKAILETGILSDLDKIANASLDVLGAGADFIKTSTGKVSQGATLEAAAVMLLVAQQAVSQLKRECGVKIAGGVREIHQAAQYVELADNIMGRERVKTSTFRIGTSKLLA